MLWEIQNEKSYEIVGRRNLQGNRSPDRIALVCPASCPAPRAVQRARRMCFIPDVYGQFRSLAQYASRPDYTSARRPIRAFAGTIRGSSASTVRTAPPSSGLPGAATCRAHSGRTSCAMTLRTNAITGIWSSSGWDHATRTGRGCGATGCGRERMSTTRRPPRRTSRRSTTRSSAGTTRNIRTPACVPG